MSTLFLKYRPKTFTDLVGQESIVKTLQNAIKAKKPAHAYLFAGSRGTGKTSIARIFAKSLNCEALSEGNPCGKCKICADITEGNLIDIVEIDAASHTGVDNIRNIIEKIDFTPTYAQRKVYIIDEVHMLSKGAFNALLKTLEEPPKHVFFLLATTELHKIPETIISRCQTFTFQRFSLEQLVNRLKDICKTEKFETKDPALQLIARKAEGGMRDAISLLEQIAAETEKQITESAVRESLGVASSEILENFWKAILEKDREGGIKILQAVNEIGGDFRSFGHDFLNFLRERLHKHLSNENELQQILPAIEETEKALARLKTSPIIELPLEIAVVNLCQEEIVGANLCVHPRNEAKKEMKKMKEASDKAPLLRGEGGVKPTCPPKPWRRGKAIKTKQKENISQQEEPDPDENIQLPDLPKNKERTHVSAKITITETSLSEKMREIADKSGITAFAKRSFLSTTPKVTNEEIIFVSDSEFHREKLVKPSVHGSLQNAISEIFREKVPIKFEKGAVKKQKPVEKKKEEEASVDDFLSF